MWSEPELVWIKLDFIIHILPILSIQFLKGSSNSHEIFYTALSHQYFSQVRRWAEFAENILDTTFCRSIPFFNAFNHFCTTWSHSPPFLLIPKQQYIFPVCLLVGQNMKDRDSIQLSQKSCLPKTQDENIIFGAIKTNENKWLIFIYTLYI